MKKRSIFASMIFVGIQAVTLFMAGSFPALAENSQQSKMTLCNQQAGGKKGDERKAFMKDCLSNKPTAAASAAAASSPTPPTPMTQQDKMKMCNKQATGKKGDERKAFMKQCLSSDKR